MTSSLTDCAVTCEGCSMASPRPVLAGIGAYHQCDPMPEMWWESSKMKYVWVKFSKSYKQAYSVVFN